MISVANLGVWITGSGIIGAMLDNKDAGGVIIFGVFAMIGIIFLVALVERRPK